MHRFIALDTETTGVDFNYSQVIQCGAVFLREDLEPAHRREWNVNYDREAFAWDKAAEEVHGISEAGAMVHGVDVETFLREFEHDIFRCYPGQAEIHIIAINAYFDFLMLESLWRKNRNTPLPLSRRVVDLSSIGLFLFGEAGTGTMLSLLGIEYEKEKQHSALYDAELHLQLFRAFSERLAAGDGNKGLSRGSPYQG